MTPERVLAATRLVKAGERVSLGRIIDENIPVFPGRGWRQTVDMTPHDENLRRPDAHGRAGITEIQAGTSQVGTQLDSIGHIQTGDRFYNGWQVRDVVEGWSLNRLGTETIPPIIARGVLVNVAASEGVDRIDAD